MDTFHFLSCYLKHKLLAQNYSSIQNDFVRNFLRTTYFDERRFYAFQEIATRRNKLDNDERMIRVQDFGANPKNNYKKKVSVISKRSAVQARFGEMMFKIADYTQAMHVLEFGTSLGLGTAYLAKANSKNIVFTLEGCAETAKHAKQTFEELQIKNALLWEGKFDDTLPLIFELVDELDLVYFDGNHSYEATIKYFEACLGKAIENSIFIFDDIHWSRGMTRAWQEIMAHKTVHTTIDLFYQGIVFFSKRIPEGHYTVRY